MEADAERMYKRVCALHKVLVEVRDLIEIYADDGDGDPNNIMRAVTLIDEVL